MLHPGALSQKSFKKKVYLGIWKMLGLHKKVAFHATDEEEEVFVKKVFGENVEVKVAGNFPNSFSEFATLRKVKNELKLATVALISPMKNILEVVRAVGSLQSAVGSGQLAVGSWQVEYDIFGPVKDSEYWEKCKQVIDGMPANVKVSYHGPVSGEELELALINCHVFVLPSKSENYGHAIVEALSAGRPVITSENVPWKGLKDSHAGINVNMENENELSEAIRFFCEMDQDTLDEWSGGARRYFESRIDLEKIRREYEEMFK
jgi:glycosyltransferase involved in cell wall biosynthesis